MKREVDEDAPPHEHEEKLFIGWVQGVLVGRCVVCKNPTAEHSFVVRWRNDAGRYEYLTLCPEGERVLIFRLLRAYIARKLGRNPPKVGYNGPIPKDLKLDA